MPPVPIQVYIAIAGLLIQAGLSAEEGIKALLAKFHATLTESEMNAICAQVVTDAVRRKALADADAAGLPTPPAGTP